jgi:hypothetical protein
MQIQIQNQRKLEEIQTDFNSAFPYLKIEFFSGTHTRGGSSEKTGMLESGITVAECRTSGKEGTLILREDMTVAELEQTFYREFGLPVQVFRKTDHHTWLETTATDFWTLKRQNQQGQELMELKRSDSPREEIDYD